MTRPQLIALLKECRIWFDSDYVGSGYWTAAYRKFRDKLDKAIDGDIQGKD